MSGFKKVANRATTQVMMKTGRPRISSEMQRPGYRAHESTQDMLKRLMIGTTRWKRGTVPGYERTEEKLYKLARASLLSSFVLQ